MIKNITVQDLLGNCFKFPEKSVNHVILVKKCVIARPAGTLVSRKRPDTEPKKAPRELSSSFDSKLNFRTSAPGPEAYDALS